MDNAKESKESKSRKRIDNLIKKEISIEIKIPQKNSYITNEQ